jgi:hypothetical protein
MRSEQKTVWISFDGQEFMEYEDVEKYEEEFIKEALPDDLMARLRKNMDIFIDSVEVEWGNLLREDQSSRLALAILVKSIKPKEVIE